MVPLFFFSVTVPGGCRSQGCHGYPTRSALVLEAPLSFQAPSPSSSIVDEFNGSDRTCARIFVRFGEVDVFEKSLKGVVFLVLFLCLSSLPNILVTTTGEFQGTQRH